MSARESAIVPEDSGLNWGRVELLGGEVLVQFVPMETTERIHGLGRNGASIPEIRTIMDDLSDSDIRRTIRTILR